MSKRIITDPNSIGINPPNEPWLRVFFRDKLIVFINHHKGPFVRKTKTKRTRLMHGSIVLPWFKGTSLSILYKPYRPKR